MRRPGASVLREVRNGVRVGADVRAPESPYGRGMTLNVVIVGAGPAALEAALALRHHAQDRVRLTVVAPETEFVYRPVSVVEPFAMGSARHYPLRDIARDVDAAHLAGALAAVEPDEHRIALASGTDVHYNVLVLAVGARP